MSQPMGIVGAVDVHRKQLTFDYVDTATVYLPKSTSVLARATSGLRSTLRVLAVHRRG
jgi:hypothetical protein